MKRILTLWSVAAIVFCVASCKEKPEPDTPTESAPEFTELSVSPEAVTVPGDLSVHAVISDAATNLSTLEISAALGNGTVIASASVRTQGQQANVDQTLAIPFTAGMAQGAEIAVSCEAVNVDGKSTKQVKKVSINRPSLPDNLYMKIGEDVFAMAKDEANANLYKTEVGSYESITTAVISTAEDASAADLIWGTSKEANKAEICSFSDASGISISFPTILVEQYTFDAVSFEVKAVGTEVHVSVAGTELQPESGMLYANIAFEKNAEIEITGIDDLDNAWNRDFFEPASNGKFKFLRESGSYDVYYSPRYNYIWIVKNGAVAPECLWIVGHGFTESPVWHEDFGYGGWEFEPVTRVAYAVAIGDNKYQCSLYLNNEHEWATFEFEVYSGLDWSKANGFGGKTISGFNKGVRLSNAADQMPGLTSDTGFQPGYYTIVFDNATGDINLTRHTEWIDTGGSGVFINGTELLTAEKYDYATIEFTNGEEVSYSGITASQLNRDFFRFEGDKAYFQAVSGSYLVQYFPEYEYTWISNRDQVFPDVIWVLGSGKWAAPVYSTSAAWEDGAYNREAPYFVVAPKIGENTYQATMSMSTDNNDWRVLLEFYSDLSWGDSGTKPRAITGPAADRFYLNPEHETWFCGVDEKEDPFQPGNYRFVFTKLEDGLSVEVTKID